MDQTAEIEKLKNQVSVLQNRCAVLSHGMMCVFCQMECTNRTANYQDSEAMEELERNLQDEEAAD